MTNEFRRWSGNTGPDSTTRGSDAISRIWSGPAKIQHSPKFTFSADEKFFTIGSCFAREIESALLEMGYPVLSRPNIMGTGILSVRDGVATQDFYNRYNLASMRDEVLHLSGGMELQGLLYKGPDETYEDCHYTPALTPSALDVCLERRRLVGQILSDGLSDATTVILTLGLSEAWFDSVCNRFLNVISSPLMLRRYRGQLVPKVIYYEEAHKYLTEIVKRLTTKKILITVSPVPLGSTFQDRDVVVENTLSKSILRAVADDIARIYPNVDYFPTYEMVTYSDPTFAWKPDGRHVRPEMVKKIMQWAISTYVPSV